MRCKRNTAAGVRTIMSTTPKSEAQPAGQDEERLSQALVTRGLVTSEEVAQCKPAPGGPTSSEGLLARLVKADFLTASQAKRVSQELNLIVGQQIPGYQLLQKLGQGSMGIVFKARQLSMNRLVAVKVLKPRLANDPKGLERFLHEAHVAAQLSHSNIIQAIDAGSAGKIHYFVMEYVEGTEISKLIDGGKVFKEPEALEIILQITQALEHANGRHLVHRDIKPANIVMTKDGVAKLADLGLALQAGDALAKNEQGIIYGTPYYISPEQIQGKDDIDIRADIYALGATLYHMVTGQPPFQAESIDAILDAHLSRELTPPDHINTELSSGLGEVVEFMMAKDRNRRYRSPTELILDLQCLIAGDAPKYARQRIEADMLKQLAEGDTDDDPIAVGDRAGVAPIWVSVLGAVLGLSLLVNLILMIRR
jgi:serine/threonine protein kinase